MSRPINCIQCGKRIRINLNNKYYTCCQKCTDREKKARGIKRPKKNTSYDAMTDFEESQHIETKDMDAEYDKLYAAFKIAVKALHEMNARATKALTELA